MEGRKPTSRSASNGRDSQQRAHLYFNLSVDALNILSKAAVDGHDRALEVLADLSGKLSTRGGDWHQMGYLMK
ncbi:MAG: hypothetical protein ABSF45_23855 [Terriglobia bacterium]|jgi:hypothetical protein